MGNFKKVAVGSGLFLLLAGTAFANEIAVITEDESGNVVTKLIEKKAMKDSMVKIISSTNNSVIHSIQDKEIKAGKWSLSKIGVGLGLEGTIGIGPWDFGAGIKQRVFFARN